ncbi:FAD-binding domain-containing protein [Globomyces pollinis-pini]|nr:FAD-binding domain-containing protein [Globomyces pollinis-pini]
MTVKFQGNNWMENKGKRQFLAFLWCAAQGLYFLVCPRISINSGAGMWIASSASNVLNILLGIILFTVCRNIINLVRGTFLGPVIPYDKHSTFHSWIGYSICFWSLVHVVGYLVTYQSNYYFNSILDVLLANGSGITGLISIISLLVMSIFCYGNLKVNRFNWFWITHRLYIILYVALFFHTSFGCFGSLGFYRCRDNETSLWSSWIISGLIYLFEVMYRELRSRRSVDIIKVIQHPSNVVEIHFKKEFFNPQTAQYIFICCPEISSTEWHPFTLTSSPFDDHLSIHMRVVGDWTMSFAQQLGGRFGSKEEQHLQPARTLPKVLIEGCFGQPSNGILNQEIAILIATDDNVIPYASTLKSISYLLKYPDQSVTKLKQVYFVWSAKDIKKFDWFSKLVNPLQSESLQIIFQTPKVTDFESGKDQIPLSNIGASSWHQIFSMVQQNHLAMDVGVFYSGPDDLGEFILKTCHESSPDGTRFHYNIGL